jgi:hypothetical protein
MPSWILEITLTSLTVTMAVIGGLLVVILFLRNSKESRYNEERSRVELAYWRHDLERQLSEINARLSSTQSQFNDVNHLLLTSQKNERDLRQKPDKSYLSNFLTSAGVTTNDLEINPKLVFVLTPFHDDAKETFDTIVKTCRLVGLECLRGDETRATGSIMTQILKYIVRARLIIANISGRNPNVYYELGIAHALDKPVLLVAKAAERIEFDVQSIRVVFYENPSELASLLLPAIAQIMTQETEQQGQQR